MYNSYFGFKETPFSVTPDPRVFYTNRLYQEALSALLYGIEAKKGFIVITGEVGTGKTTLLRKLMRNLEATTHSVFIFNTHLSFPELLQLILHDLGLAHDGKSRVTMIQELNDYLIAQLQKGHIVSLLIDEAQNLSDETLEGLRLLSNLETDKEKLLQIVLMGQPELEVKLDQPQLRQLKQRVALQCRLARLRDQEVGPFIDFRLRAVGYEGEGLFNPDAVKQIASYSKGIPRLINIICDNALLIAYGTSQRTVSAEMIKEVANDLRLEEGPKAVRVEAPPIKVAATNGNEGAPRGVEGKPLQYQPRRLALVGIGTLLLLLLFEGGIAIYSEQTEDDLSNLRHKIGNFLEIIGEHFEFSKITGYRQASKESQTSSETVGVDERDQTAEDLKGAEEQLRRAREDLIESKEVLSRNEPATPLRSESPTEPSRERENRDILSPRQSSISKDRARTQVSGDSEIRRKKIELEINKAIRNRAIAGVEVSFMKGTAYLEGQVETETQKSAAEQAARGVAEVKEVRSSIWLNPVLSPLFPER